MEASPRASRARKRRYENVRLRILLSIHTGVHSGKENITEKPSRVTSKDIFSFFLFTPSPSPPSLSANFENTTTLTAGFLMDFFVFSVFCSLPTMYFWPYSATLSLFVRQQFLLMSRPCSSSFSVLFSRRKLDR